jgi:hypothetical protein
MRTTDRTTVSRDPALVALLATLPDYPGASAILDAADRAWARARGVAVGERVEAVPLHVAATRARQQRQSAAAKKKRRAPKQGA